MSIKILNNSIINKIAAGEVIERPAAVVKELVENSIDANSTQITIEVIEGGKELIRITDNGSGINKEEIKTAFLRHATSKIENLNDLENILTLGFRGEALSSISSVARVTVTTKTKEAQTGIVLSILDGEILEEKEIAATKGTTFVVENLFYNVPARLKFLKKTATESSKISELITKFALGNPNISFKYINNNNTLLETNGSNKLNETIYNIYGRQIGKAVLPISVDNKYCVLNGFICKGEEYRSNRNYENFYINGRFIKSSILEKAAEDAYKEFLPIGKFPIIIINIVIDPTVVDVNVHPTKLEVRFSNEDKIYEALYTAIKKTLSSVNLIPNKVLVKEKPIKNEFVEEIIYDEIKLDEVVFKDSLRSRKNIGDLIYNGEIPKDDSKASTEIPINAPVNTPTFTQTDTHGEKNKSNIVHNVTDVKMPNKKLPFFKDYTILNQIFNTFWMVQSSGKLYMIDQHAAHERILFEQFKDKFANSQVITQNILEPIVLVLSDEDSEVINNNFELFENFGFEIENFGRNTFALRTLPFVFNNTNQKDFFLELMENIKGYNKNYESISDAFREKIISMSCKAAVKANDNLSYMEAEKIIKDLMLLENPFTCPHGRPTVIEISKYEIEKLFNRANV
ncbi:MAG: DNA mismatch repair endonuclease MutL [Lachnospirales bacterium]